MQVAMETAKDGQSRPLWIFKFQFIELFVEDFCNPVILSGAALWLRSRRIWGFTDLLPNRSLDYARDDSLVRNLKQLHKLQFIVHFTSS